MTRRGAGQKRKHSEALAPTLPAEDVEEARRLVPALRSSLLNNNTEGILCLVKSIGEYAKLHDETIDPMVEEGAVQTLSNVLEAKHPPDMIDEVEKETAFALGHIAVKPENQRKIGDSAALPLLVKMLVKRAAAPTPGSPLPPAGAMGLSVARFAADAITNITHENVPNKTRVRTEGGIPTLVEMLESLDTKEQKAAASCLRTLAFKNDDNKNRIVDCGALPLLVTMLHSDERELHYEAVGAIGNLVHSAPYIKRRVLEEGALQPVIRLLSSKCTESQREAALLLGQFATTDPDYKAKIVQRGAVRPLIQMLSLEDSQLREMSAFALGRLAQNQDNQAGIVQQGGLKPLLENLNSRCNNIQHNAAFALYGLADNEDNISQIVKEGVVQRLLSGMGHGAYGEGGGTDDNQLFAQPSRDCVMKTIKRLEEKVTGRVLNQLLYLLRTSQDLNMRRCIATALAHLSTEEDRRVIFAAGAPCGALEVLLDMLIVAPVRPVASSSSRKGVDGVVAAEAATLASAAAAAQAQAASALANLLTKMKMASPIAPPPPPSRQPQGVYLGEDNVNNSRFSDVTFIVDGEPFHAHKIALLDASDAFRAMFDGGYKEQSTPTIEIPNITLAVWEAMMRCIYTGTVAVAPEMARHLLQAADQYLLESLKPLCENVIAQDVTVENVGAMFDLAEKHHAPNLKNKCVQFALDKFPALVEAHDPHGCTELFARMRKQLQHSLQTCAGAKPTDHTKTAGDEVSTPDAAAAANGNLLAGNIVNAANANAGAGPAAALIIAALPANALAHAANPNNLQPAAAAAAALAAQAAAVALVDPVGAQAEAEAMREQAGGAGAAQVAGAGWNPAVEGWHVPWNDAVNADHASAANP